MVRLPRQMIGLHMGAIGGNNVKNPRLAKYLLVALIVTAAFGTAVRASDSQDAHAHPPEMRAQIQLCTNLTGLMSFLQNSNDWVRQAALTRWELLPINLGDLEMSRALRGSSDRYVKLYAACMCSNIEILQRDEQYRGVVFGSIEASLSVSNLYDYLVGHDELLQRFAMMKWKRIEPHIEDRACLESLMTNADWRVAIMSVAKYGRIFRADADVRLLTALTIRKDIPAPTKVEIVRILGQIQSAASEEGIVEILEKRLREGPGIDIKYAYRDQDYYDVSNAAIEALAQSHGENARRVLKKIADDDSVYSNLRKRAAKAIEVKE